MIEPNSTTWADPMLYFRCPGCGKGYKAFPAEIRSFYVCPVCGRGIEISEPREALVLGDSEGLGESRPDSYRPHPGRRNNRGAADPWSVAGLVFGVLSCQSMGTCMFFALSWYVAFPFAVVGLGCSAAGSGDLRVAGLLVNGLALVPSAFLLYRLITGTWGVAELLVNGIALSAPTWS